MFVFRIICIALAVLTCILSLFRRKAAVACIRVCFGELALMFVCAFYKKIGIVHTFFMNLLNKITYIQTAQRNGMLFKAVDLTTWILIYAVIIGVFWLFSVMFSSYTRSGRNKLAPVCVIVLAAIVIGCAFVTPIPFKM